jgi:hypothetical protein
MVTRVCTVVTAFDRVAAMRTLLDVLPSEPSPHSPFEFDTAGVPFKTYDVARTRLQDGIVTLNIAARAARDEPVRLLGMHLVMLRPALVSAAKAWWLVNDRSAGCRVGRAIALVAADRASGAEAMAAAASLGHLPAFGQVAQRFTSAHSQLHQAGDKRGVNIPRLPGDGRLIDAIGIEIDAYYGTHGPDSARLDARLLWNVSSGLAHGERWFRDMTTSRVGTTAQREQIVETLTNRSLDVVCSALNVSFLRCLTLASTPPGAPT